MHIVIVDDDTFEIEPLVHILAERGATVELIGSTQEARRRLLDRDIDCDLVVVDIVMPTDGIYTGDTTSQGTLTGIRLIEDLRANRPNVRVAALTIRGDSEVVKALGEAKVVAHFRKPFFVKQLAADLMSVASRPVER